MIYRCISLSIQGIFFHLRCRWFLWISERNTRITVAPFLSYPFVSHKFQVTESRTHDPMCDYFVDQFEARMVGIEFLIDVSRPYPTLINLSNIKSLNLGTFGISMIEIHSRLWSMEFHGKDNLSSSSFRKFAVINPLFSHCTDSHSSIYVGLMFCETRSTFLNQLIFMLVVISIRFIRSIGKKAVTMQLRLSWLKSSVSCVNNNW